MDGLNLPAGSSLAVYTAEEPPDLWQEVSTGFRGIWPEYNLHGNHGGSYFGELIPRFARFQLLVYDAAIERVVGRGRTIPSGGTGHRPTCPPELTLSACAGSRSRRRQPPCPHLRPRWKSTSKDGA
jgi:hypothetical protein